MSYVPHGMIIHSVVDEIAPRAVRVPLTSNGTLLRTEKGTVLGTDDGKPAIIFSAEYFDQRYLGQITEPYLVERIERYWCEGIQMGNTNCSAFAHYLTTGELVDCRTVRRGLVLRQGMRPFEMSSRVDVGDMVGLIYQNKRVALSRMHGYRVRGRHNQQLRRQYGTFACTAAMKWQRRPFSPVEFLELYEGLSGDDYHFMVCVAKLDGQPVWLSQTAYHYPHEPADTFAVTVGLVDPFPVDIPIAAFIKKAR